MSSDEGAALPPRGSRAYNVFNTPYDYHRPLPWPPKPDLNDEVNWGAYPTADQYEEAFKLWRLLNNNDSGKFPPAEVYHDDYDPNLLQRNEKRPGARPAFASSQAVLVRRAYSGILKISQFYFPTPVNSHVVNHPNYNPDDHPEPEEPEEPDEFAQCPFPDENDPGFHADDISAIIPMGSGAGLSYKDIRVDGMRYNEAWRKSELIEALKARGIYDEESQRTNPMKKDALYKYELQRKSIVRELRRSHLPGWGLHRKATYIIPSGDNETYLPFDVYTLALLRSPYNPAYWTSRSFLFYQQGYYDLALGDAYRAWYLVEVLVNPAYRNKQPGLHPRIVDAITEHLVRAGKEEKEVITSMRGPNGIVSFLPPLRRTFHHIIALSLLNLRAFEDLEQMDSSILARLRGNYEEEQPFKNRQHFLKDFANSRNGNEANGWEHEMRMGHVESGGYPQSEVASVRYSLISRNNLTTGYINQGPNANAKKPLLKVREKLKGLGVYATKDIPAGTIIHIEEPTIRGHLQRTLPATEEVRHYCENCKRRILKGAIDLADQTWQALSEEEKQENNHQTLCSCLGTEKRLYFCGIEQNLFKKLADDKKAEAAAKAHPRKQRRRRLTALEATEELEAEATAREGRQPTPDPSWENREACYCLPIARQIYHHRSCGREWAWLHQGMVNTAADPKIPRPAENYERHHTLLSLLLREVFDMTLLERDENPKSRILAHEIDALFPLCGGTDTDLIENVDDDKDNPSPQFFPFTYAGNIIVPFDILQTLGVNIFRDFDFDTWVIQTVLRKLLLNVVPWDKARRGAKNNINTPRAHRLLNPLQKDSLTGAHFENLYVHPGFSLFNHACGKTANADWFWDQLEKTGQAALDDPESSSVPSTDSDEEDDDDDDEEEEEQQRPRGKARLGLKVQLQEAKKKRKRDDREARKQLREEKRARFLEKNTEEEEIAEINVPNRLIVRTRRIIRKDEEVTINYFPDIDFKPHAEHNVRLFGQRCLCLKCFPNQPANGGVGGGGDDDDDDGDDGNDDGPSGGSGGAGDDNGGAGDGGNKDDDAPKDKKKKKQTQPPPARRPATRSQSKQKGEVPGRFTNDTSNTQEVEEAVDELAG